MRPVGPRLVVMVALAFISGAQSSTNQQQSQSSIRGKLYRDESARNDETSPATASTSLLSNINPWLSACDLAQPSTAPDLQGSCSAGTLPVAWIEEGPGPPLCPPSCQQKYHVNDRYNQNTSKNNKDNKVKNKQNNNNNNNFSNKSNNNKNNNGINMENRLYENRQCLDYLGDNDEYSPSQICKKSSSDIETKLKSIRLRHCCERDVLSALHNEAYSDVLNGGAGCVKRLNDLVEADSLAARITCEFMEILVRYDCGHRYSLKHNCKDCKEMYRRWVCSTFIPYFSTRNDIKSDPEPVTLSDTDAALSSSNLLNNIDNKAQKMFKQTYSLESSNEIKRSRRKVQKEKRIRIRPCLSVCQTVEQKCPYMLPADRAPAYPTQYAGEPTFLCLDPNIDETGNQRFKSNNGPSECCYEYCSHADGLCSGTCETIFNSNHTAITPNNLTQNSTQSTINTTPNLFVKLENGTYILNDYSHMPLKNEMACPALPNITQSTQQCSISQAQAASSATSFYSLSVLSSVTSFLIVSMQQLLIYLGSLTSLHFRAVFIVKLLESQWVIIAWNLLSFNALRHILLRLATGL